ncbi:MAG: FKBP-type peptidyl-prolyl cis-trans isomerase [Candidatus Thiodiazotropha sp.]|nr:FKBP-type peptidyl-prolyl cis-trans isomerase [Candidatus Thiodiazotropha sp.]MCM8884822.1 FKBP-type peptidyl-prolyl cis-trans isomerase [Candidatus Thiodiazotropha sp.]MCM8919318.1 FKBP-type peptidyl-prolyl cis-trans isomerase [Candidatus Thiodiazotropha sp.]
MHIQLTTALIVSLASGLALSDEQLKLTDEADRINYAIGHQIGSDFKKQQVDLDRQALQQGIQDGYISTQPKLEKREMNHLLVNLKRDITNDMESEATERMQKKLAQMKHKRQLGYEFLETNKTKAGVITTTNGLQYKVISTGSGPMPNVSDQVKIHYRARRLSGQEFNSSYKKGGASIFRVNGVIPGFTEALQLMQPGAKWEIFLSPELAYGRQGPLAHETIIIEVELLEIISPQTAKTEIANPGQNKTTATSK